MHNDLYVLGDKLISLKQLRCMICGYIMYGEEIERKLSFNAKRKTKAS